MKFLFIFLLLLIAIVLIVQETENFSPSRTKVVFSFSTSPKRISKIEPFLNSLLSQTRKPDYIYANLPKVFKRDNSTFLPETIPDFLTKNPKVIINYTEDIGPATKIVPTISLLDDPETIVISVDDDILYSPGLTKLFLSYSQRFPDCVITGTSFINDSTMPNIGAKIYYAQFLEGFSGVLYKKKFFDGFSDKFITVSPKECFLADDLMLSNFILSKGIKILSIESRNMIKEIEYGKLSDALHAGSDPNETSNIKNYRTCIKWLKKENLLSLKDIQKNVRNASQME